MIIREISSKDNPAIERLIRAVLISFGANREGFAFVDPELKCMFESYHHKGSVYYVLEEGGRLLGGAGIAPLKAGSSAYCELQKMYFLPEARGKGHGKQMMERCLAFARQERYRYCYLETLEEMYAARALYEASGFEYIHERMGNTGHSACPVFMLKSLF